MAPFDQTRFEIDFLTGDGFQIDMFFDEYVLDEIIADFVALVQIDCTDQCFKGISIHVVVVGTKFGGVHDHLVESQFDSNTVHRLALYDFGTGVGQESFPLVLKVFVNDIGYDRIQYGITQKLQPFIIQPSAVTAFYGRRFMEEGLFIKVDVIGIKTEYLV